MSDSKTHKVPTEKQYDTLRALGSGSAGLSFKKRDAEPLLRRGWVTAELHEPYYQWVRITPDGLRALALAVEKFGLPELGPKQQKWQSFCRRCDSTDILTRAVDVEIPVPA